MLLGKRPRPRTRRTASMTGVTFDVSNPDASEPSSGTAPLQDHPNAAPEAVTVHQGTTPVSAMEGCDPWFLAMVSPRNYRRSHSIDYVEPANFLRTCGLCHRRLAPGRDIYMYRGDTAYCSMECREQQMMEDERKERYGVVSSVEEDAHRS